MRGMRDIGIDDERERIFDREDYWWVEDCNKIRLFLLFFLYKSIYLTENLKQVPTRR